MQLKCSEVMGRNNGHFNFDLDTKNYRELRGDRYGTPRILVVVYVPGDVDYWIQQSEEQLVMRRCGYWVSLRTAPESSNTSSVRVRIPEDNQFNVDALRAMMLSVGNGGSL